MYDIVLLFMLILRFIHTLDYFLTIPHGVFLKDFVITTPVLDRLDNILQLL